jgi:hypothetical protein
MPRGGAEFAASLEGRFAALIGLSHLDRSVFYTNRCLRLSKTWA